MVFPQCSTDFVYSEQIGGVKLAGAKLKNAWKSSIEALELVLLPLNGTELRH